MSLARKRSGLVVTKSKAVGTRVRNVAQARRGEVEVASVFRIPDHSERGVVCKGGVFWMDAVVCGIRGGACAADIAGLLPHCAHGLIVLFRQVVVTVQVPAPGQLGQKHRHGTSNTHSDTSAMTVHYSASKNWDS